MQVLYESHSVLHGRPYPLKGRFFANICKLLKSFDCVDMIILKVERSKFHRVCCSALTVIHFEPTGHSLRHNAEQENLSRAEIDKKYRDALAKGFAGHENSAADGLPSYIVPGTPEESNWRASHPNGYSKQKQESFTTGSTPAHLAAQVGDTQVLAQHIEKNKEWINARDSNGWTPLMERYVEYIDLVF